MELAALFVTSFLAITLLPGGSEVALLKLHPAQTAPTQIPATVANTLGDMAHRTSSAGESHFDPTHYLSALCPLQL